MATFTGRQIKNTYQGIVQIDGGVLKDAIDNPLTASIDTLSVDNNFTVSGSTKLVGDSVSITGSLAISGSIQDPLLLTNGFFANKALISEPITVPPGYNALLLSPIDNSSDITVDITANLTIL